MLRFLFALMLLAAFSVGVYAQELSPEKLALYTKYYELKKGGADGQKLAFDVAKEYLQKFGSDTDQYTEAVRKFVQAYEKASREVNFYKSYNAKEYARTFDIGAQILASEPENFAIIGTLVRAGYFSAFGGNKSLNKNAVGSAKRGLELLETSKVTKPDPFESFDEAAGFLNYVIGFITHEESPQEAVVALSKAGRIGGTKIEPTTFYYLAGALLKAEYEPLSEEYQLKYAGKDETPEGKEMFAKLVSIGNQAIDAYARAVALSSKPEQAKFKNQVLAELTELYKSFHNDSDEGLKEFISSVLSKPLP